MLRDHALIFVLPLVASACLSFHWSDVPSHPESLQMSDPVVEVRIETRGGDVEIAADDVASVDVAANIKGSKNRLLHESRAGVLSLSVGCIEDPCDARIRAIVPRTVRVAAKTGSGDIVLRGGQGSALLETGSGNISASDLTGSEIRAHTGSGDVQLVIAKPSQRLSVTTGSGDVHLRVPTGKYRLAVDTGSGEQRVQGVSEDAAAEAAIDIDTGSGDVKIDGA